MKKGLREKGLTLTSLAKELGLAASTICSVKYVRYPSIEAAIASRLGMSAMEIWPSRYPAVESEILAISAQEEDD
ncbi:DNA-binding transcriptional regulator Nlp [compost metagenome]